MRTDDYLLERVHHWHEHIKKFMPVDFPPPKTELVISHGRRLGWQQGEFLFFNRTYLYLISDDEFEELVAHEVCHYWQCRLMPESQYHGEFWMFLIRIVCGFKSAEAKSSTYVGKDKRKAISQLLKCREALDDLNRSNQETA